MDTGNTSNSDSGGRLRFDIKSPDDIKDVKPESKPLSEAVKEESIEIDLTQNPEPKESTTSVDFKDSSFLHEEVAKSTVESAATKSETSGLGDRTVGEIRNQIKEEEANSENQFTKEDFETFAEIIIDIIDIGITSGLRWYAKDTSDSAYSITQTKKNKLVTQLARLLIKYQAKLSLEFLFLVTLVMVYSTPFKKANESRKRVKDQEARESEAEAKEKKEEAVEDIPHTVIEEDKSEVKAEPASSASVENEKKIYETKEAAEEVRGKWQQVYRTKKGWCLTKPRKGGATIPKKRGGQSK